METVANDQPQIEKIVQEGTVIVEPQATPAIVNAIKSLEPNELLQALYFIWDAAERGQLQVFLMGDTAKQVKANEALSGDKITVGVRRNEWNSGQGRIAQTFIEHAIGQLAIEEGKKVVYQYQNVPIVIKLYEENPTLSGFDIVYYGYETFNLPNPYDEFVKKYE